MTFLIDNQLPRRLQNWLERKGHAAIHSSRVLRGASTSDEALWCEARNNGWVIISKDDDFRQRSAVRGAPPALLYILIGNCSNEDLTSRLNSRWHEIEPALAAGARMVAVDRDRVDIFFDGE